MNKLLLTLAILAGVWLLAILALVVSGRRLHARELATFLPNLIRLFRDLARDARVPTRTKWLLLFAALWVASPIDLIPEFIPVLGPLDDAVMAALVLRHIVKVAGPQVVSENWRGDPRTLRTLLRIARITPTGEGA